jgi:DNA-binding transcriptional MerR regulator
MRIGELSERTGTSPRLLRYYEEQGLITPDRRRNGYRDYDERLIDRVWQIRGLLDIGMPTRIIKQVLPCLDVPGVLVCQSEASTELVRTLEEERDRMSRRIEHLVRNRDAITTYLARLPRSAEA